MTYTLFITAKATISIIYQDSQRTKKSLAAATTTPEVAAKHMISSLLEFFFIFLYLLQIKTTKMTLNTILKETSLVGNN